MVMILPGVVCRCQIKPSTVHVQRWSTFFALDACNIHTRYEFASHKHWTEMPPAVQTPSTGLWHPSSDHCHNWVCHRSRKTSASSFSLVLKWKYVCNTVTDKSNYIKRLFYIYLSMLLTPSQIKTKTVWIKMELFFFSPLNLKDVPHVMCMHWHHVGSHSLISTQTFPRALTVSVDSCAEVKSGPSLAQPNLAEFGGRCQKVTLGVRPRYWHRCDLPSAPRDLFSQSTVCVAQAPGAITCIHFQAIVWTDESTAHW